MKQTNQEDGEYQTAIPQVCNSLNNNCFHRTDWFFFKHRNAQWQLTGTEQKVKTIQKKIGNHFFSTPQLKQIILQALYIKRNLKKEGDHTYSLFLKWIPAKQLMHTQIITLQVYTIHCPNVNRQSKKRRATIKYGQHQSLLKLTPIKQ